MAELPGVAGSASPPTKAEGAFRTISEVARQLGLQQHILRYWETKFPQLRPLQRAGNRRYYRPADVKLVERIDRLLNHEGYTMRGVQKLLADDAPSATVAAVATAKPLDPQAELRVLRDRLAGILSEDLAK